MLDWGLEQLGVITTKSEGKRAAKTDVPNGMRRDARQELRLIKRGVGVDLCLHAFCVERHHDVGQQGQCTGDGHQFLVAPSALCPDRARGVVLVARYAVILLD